MVLLGFPHFARAQIKISPCLFRESSRASEQVLKVEDQRGVTDKCTWLRYSNNGNIKCPLLFDENYNKTLAYSGFLAAWQ
ncbi:Glycosyl hydrolase family 10 [Mucilaginibacter gossypii]|uniref:Glycosyl hydrolase family 10 n=1 Tax=Mucilaginibacter gossypii TaxID=551996 RepID=A0A1G7YN15_9SPHI|nr:Glycosyl hydrolase family 10 [Mucilaginibacter gossypii]